ncbi:MAG: hypothetical protein CMJ40_05350 [Phycisphaerae bacterium]|nr:hypothetical protein [Phycisphaerae bacterium]
MILGTADVDHWTRFRIDRASGSGSDIMHEAMSSQFEQALRGPIPFPVEAARTLNTHDQWLQTARNSVSRILKDRRMNVLARQLGCLGYYDNDPDDPCAA